jgi:hypothetical protein
MKVFDELSNAGRLPPLTPLLLVLLFGFGLSTGLE